MRHLNNTKARARVRCISLSSCWLFASYQNYNIHVVQKGAFFSCLFTSRPSETNMHRRTEYMLILYLWGGPVFGATVLSALGSVIS